MAAPDPIVDLDLVIGHDRWTEALPDCADLAQQAIASAYTEVAFGQPAMLCLLLADDDRLQALNRDYRGKDKPTNVLSFPMSDEAPSGAPRALGDIALAYQTLEREAREAGRPLRNHYQHLIVHGSLHLIGYTHEAEHAAESMESLEIAALARLGVPNPYEVVEPGQDMVRNVSE